MSRALAQSSEATHPRKSQTTCLPFRRMLAGRRLRRQKRHQRRHIARRRRQRDISGSSASTPEANFDDLGIMGLSPSSLLPSLSMATVGTAPHSRAMIALTFPLRALRRRIMHSGSGAAATGMVIPISLDSSSLSGHDDGVGGEISDDESMTASKLETDEEEEGEGEVEEGEVDSLDDGTDIDAIDEFS